MFFVQISSFSKIIWQRSDEDPQKFVKKKVRYCRRTLSVFTVDIVFVGPLGQALDQLSCPEFVLEDVLKVEGYCKKAHKAYAEICR
jgi:hypothetical protein